jgi:hypothetical protein
MVVSVSVPFGLGWPWEGLAGVICVDLIGQIRRAFFEQRRSITEISRDLRVSRTTVRKVVRSDKTAFSEKVAVQSDWCGHVCDGYPMIPSNHASTSRVTSSRLISLKSS